MRTRLPKSVEAFAMSMFAVMFSLSARPAMAAPVVHSSVVKCGDAYSLSGCGSNPATSDPLSGGWVTIDRDGSLTVELVGARPNTTYAVFVGVHAPGTNGYWWYPEVNGLNLCSYTPGPGVIQGDGLIGWVQTDGNGNYAGTVNDQSLNAYKFPSGSAIARVNIVFNNPQCGPTQFTTGIKIP